MCLMTHPTLSTVRNSIIVFAAVLHALILTVLEGLQMEEFFLT
jgi:hypothetical protein